jgi:glutaminyl-tRNA synthetase
VSALHAVPAEVRLYDRLFTKKDPMDFPEGSDFTVNLNPKSLVLKNSMVEPSVKNAKPGERFQFERLGYFYADSDTGNEKPVFNRTVSLKDEWMNLQKKVTG